MRSFPKMAAAAILSGLATVLAMPLLIDRHSASVASLALGTEDAFLVAGLEPREHLVGGSVLRWTRPNASFRFEGMGPGLVDLEINVRDHRTEVVFTANGALIGTLLPGQGTLATRIRLSQPSLEVGVRTQGFSSLGRVLGTQFESIRASPVRSAAWKPLVVPRRLWVAVGAVILVSAVACWLAALPAAFALPPPFLLLLMVMPAAIWRSGWLAVCAALTSAATLAAAVVGARARGSGFSRGWLHLSLLGALVVVGVLAPSPLLTQGDALMHGNKLGVVARGDLFPTSQTDHRPPFKIPYGVSFYALFSPLAASASSNIRVLREGAAFFSAFSVLALALLLGRSSANLAAASVALWTFAPSGLRTMGYGNLSNMFAQSIFVLFLATAGLMPKGMARSGLLGLLAAVSATAHLSSFIVLLTLTLVASLLPSDRRDPAFRPLLAGTAIACAYYATFLPIIIAQVPRILGERGGSVGVLDPWRLPAQVVSGAGWPLLALMVISYLTGALRPALPLSRSLALTAVLLALAALFSPVEVRYLLAVLPLLAIAGGSVFDEGSPRSVHLWLRALTLVLLAASIVHGIVVLQEFIPLSRV